MAYRIWRQRGNRYVKTTKTAEEQTWLGSDSRAAAKQQRDGNDSNGSGKNLNLLQKLRQDGINGCDNTVAERTWLGGSVSYSNSSGKTAAIVEALTWLTGPGGSGIREA